MKTCTSCQQCLPLEMFSQRTDRPGRRAKCRECERARSTSKSQAVRANTDCRSCTHCLAVLPLAAFPVRIRHGVTTRMGQCVECIRKRDAARYEATKPRELGGRPQYYRPMVEKVCDEAMDGWRHVVNRSRALSPAIGVAA